MDEFSLERLEFNTIKSHLEEYALSNLAKRMIRDLAPSPDFERVRLLLEETDEARRLSAEMGGGHPLVGLHDITESLDRVAKGGVLHPEDLLQIADVQRGASKVRKYMKHKLAVAPALASYANSLTETPDLVLEISRSVAGSELSDHASVALAKIRSQMATLNERIKNALQAIVTSPRYRTAIQESFVTQKAGHYVVAVKASYRKQVPGTVITASASGATLFIEPKVAERYTQELRVLEAAEQAEEYRVLAELTEMVADCLQQIRINVEVLSHYDLVFAKARYCDSIDGTKPILSSRPLIRLVGARHPLLPRDAVPLDIHLGEHFNTLVITGPNTGGKTVVLKSVGLLCLMVQSGLHIPAKQGTELGVFRDVLADIGDAQSIESSLSTFSSHMKNVSRMLKTAGPGCLVLLDEIGTGTDPAEGAALACSILWHLYIKGAISVATTHYGDVKRFSDHTPGFMNGCMEFDAQSLKPLYVLTVGKSGESCGLTIAQNLGIDREVIDLAQNMLESAGLTERLCHTVVIPTADTPKFQEPKPRDAASIVSLRKGDAVFVHSLHARGIVAEEADDKGNLVVMAKGQKISVNHKRVRLVATREQLYPDHENYDLDIVLLTKEDRKIKKQMTKRNTDAVRVISMPDSRTPTKGNNTQKR